jgi:predicted methyltransferase
MASSVRSGKTARYRARLKAKSKKERLRKAGFLKVKKAGGRMKKTRSTLRD